MNGTSAKLIKELNLKKVEGVNKVTMSRNGEAYVITDPEVYFNPNTKTYVVYGNPIPQKYQQMQMLSNLSQMFKQQQQQPHEHEHHEGCDCGHDHAEHAEQTIKEEDVATVMEAGATREQAIEAIKAEGDVVKAVMKFKEN